MFDFINANNPFSSYHFALIPYCTADLHWGNNEKKYMHLGEDFYVQHKGYVNARSVLEWVYVHYSEPETILVAGTSAGSYGAILHAADVIEQYPKSKVSELSDSGAIFPPSYDFDLNYAALVNFPEWIRENPEMDHGVSSPGFDLVRFYISMAQRYPNNTFALLNFAKDGTQ